MSSSLDKKTQISLSEGTIGIVQGLTTPKSAKDQKIKRKTAGTEKDEKYGDRQIDQTGLTLRLYIYSSRQGD